MYSAVLCSAYRNLVPAGALFVTRFSGTACLLEHAARCLVVFVCGGGGSV